MSQTIINVLKGMESLAKACNNAGLLEFVQPQIDMILNDLPHIFISFEDAAAVVTQVKSMSFLSDEQQQSLIAAVGHRAAGTDASVNGRVAMQDFTDFPEFLTDKIWSILQNTESILSQKIHILMKHLTALGLRCPSEATYAMICVMCNLATLADECTPPAEMFRRLQEVKPLAKAYCDKAGLVQSYLRKLPTDVGQFVASSAATALYIDGDRVKSKIDMETLRKTMRLVPMRSTNKLSSASSSAAQSTTNPLHTSAPDMMQMMAACMGQFLANTNGQPRIQLLPRRAQGLGQIMQQSQLALLGPGPGSHLEAPADQPSALPHSVHLALPAPPTEAARDEHKSQTMNPLEAAEQLRQDAADKENNVMKRPASKSDKSNRKATPTLAMKKTNKPGNKKNEDAKKKKTKSPKAAVPSDSLRMKLKPNGCSKCRNKPGCTPSCWANRNW